MFRRQREVINQPYYVLMPSNNEYVYSPTSGMNVPINQTNEERFGGLLIPALGGFLVGTLVPTPWGNRPMWGPQPPMMNTYSGYGYQTMMPYQPTPQAMNVNQQ